MNFAALGAFLVLLSLGIATKIVGADGPDFVSKPQNPTFSKVGSDVELSWDFQSSEPYSFISINRVSESDVHTGIIVIVVPNTGPIIAGSYKNRVTYIPDATIVLKGLTKADEGWYSVTVDFLDGSTIYNKVFLKVTDENLVLVANAHGSEGVCQVFDITSKRKCSAAVIDYPKRVNAAAGALVSGVPLICGGSDVDDKDMTAMTHDCYAHDREANRWNFVAKLKQKRNFHAAATISKKLWITGGQHGWLDRSASTEFVHLNGTVEQGPDLPYAAADHCMVTLRDGHVMVIGGKFTKRVVIFDPKSNTFTDGPSLLQRRSRHACTLFYSPMHSYRPVILTAGGYDFDNFVITGTSELLDYTQHNATWVKVSDTIAGESSFEEGSCLPMSDGALCVHQFSFYRLHCTTTACSWSKLSMQLPKSAWTATVMHLPKEYSCLD